MAESSPKVVISFEECGSSPLAMIMAEPDCDSAKRICRERVRPEIQQSSASGTVRTVGVNQVRWLAVIHCSMMWVPMYDHESSASLAV